MKYSACALVIAAASAATAGPVEFCDMSGRGASPDITVELSSERDGAVCMTVRNVGARAALVGVYIDTDRRDPLLASPTITDGPGVDFEVGGSPHDVPGWETLSPPFDSTMWFTAASPSPENGVNPGEQLMLCFEMPGGGTLADLEHQIDTGQIRIALRFTAGEDAVRLVTARCDADFDCDWAVNVNDFIAFQAAWRHGEARADWDGNGVLDVRDFIAFQADFRKGCP